MDTELPMNVPAPAQPPATTPAESQPEEPKVPLAEPFTFGLSDAKIQLDANALNDAAWEFIENAPKNGIPAVLWNNLKAALGPAIRMYIQRAALPAADAAQPQQVAPEGWKLVPVEMTDAMERAGEGAAEVGMEHDSDLGSQGWLNNVHDVYAAMLAAAPPAAQQAEALTDTQIIELAETHFFGVDARSMDERLIPFARAVLAAQPDAAEVRKQALEDLNLMAEYVVANAVTIAVNAMDKHGRAALDDWIAKNYIAPLVNYPDACHVQAFADAMKAKMAASALKGRSGWNDPLLCTDAFLRRLLVKAVRKGDPVDVGNFAMMLFTRGTTTMLPSPDDDIDQQMAVIDAQRHQRLERRLQNMPVEIERRQGGDRRRRVEDIKD